MLYAIHTPNQLAAHLRALRLAKGWSQAQLAAMMGLTQSRIARIEKDPLSIRVDQLLRMLAVLGAGASIVVPEAPGRGGASQEPSDW